ncbi:MAG: alpha/beta hydrolase-fold protein [Pseudomonadota bacterium]
MNREKAFDGAPLRVMAIIVVTTGFMAAACVPDRFEGPAPKNRAISDPDETKRSHAPTNDAPGDRTKQREPAPAGPSHKPEKSKESSDRPASARTATARPSPFTLSPDVPSRLEVTAERLEGYKTPAEYLMLRSRRFPVNVTAVALPHGYDKDRGRGYPLVIAFGGAGECARQPRRGALAWLHYYKSDEAAAALVEGKLGPDAFRGLAKPSEIKLFNGKLREYPYRGVILACPYSPPIRAVDGIENPDYEAFIMEELLPALEERYRPAPGKVGVDGVSMGGARAMYYGLKYPTVFRSIGTVQGAFGPFLDIYRDLIGRNKPVLKKCAIQLVTSDKDNLAPSVERMHQLLKTEGIGHQYLKLTGPHDYIFNEGPGVVALLTFHNQTLGFEHGLPTRGPRRGKAER